MQRFNNVHLSHELQFPDQSSIRRYYVETSSVSRRPNLDAAFQDNPDSLKFYVVARRNYASGDLPFVVPRFFSHLNTNLGLFGAVENASNDFFDRGVTTSDDSDILDDSPFPLVSSSPSRRRPLSVKRTNVVSEAGGDHDASDFFDQPFDDDFNHDQDAGYMDLQSPQRVSNLNLFGTEGLEPTHSPVNRPSRRSSAKSPVKLAKGSFKHKPAPKSRVSSPVRLSSALNRTHSVTEPDFKASTSGLLELEDLKSSRGSQKSRSDKSRSLRTSVTTNSLYKLDRKGPAGPKKTASKETQARRDVTTRGAYQIVPGPRRIVGLPKQTPEPKAKKVKKVLKKTVREGKKGELALVKKAELVEADYDMGGFDLADARQALNDSGLQSSKGLRSTAIVRRRPRPSVSSSDLLNSWYVTTRRESEESEGVFPFPPDVRPSRYPKRFRRPPSQHWISNRTSDGSSVLFVASVATEPSRHSENEPECSSLVLTNDHGEVKLQVVDKNASKNPDQKSITDYLKTLGTSSIANSLKRPEEGPLRIEDAPGLGAGRKRTGPRKIVGRGRQLTLEDDRTGARAPGPRDGKSVKRKLVKVKRDITVEDALDLLSKLPEVYDGGKTLDIAFDDSESYSEAESDESEAAREKERKLRRFHAKFLKENNKFDSFVEHGSDGIYYRTLYTRDQNEALHGELVFNPMIFTSQCRTSDVRIPANKFLDFGDVQSNFIFGYVYAGTDIAIKGDEEEKPLQRGEFFCLPTEKSWVIENNSSVFEASIALTFVNV